MTDLKPPVKGHEKQEFEGQGNGHGRYHHHAHRQQDIGNDKVDGDKRQIQQEPHLKRLGQFGNGKRGHEDQHVVFGNLIMLFLGPDALRRTHEGPEHAVLRIVRKELAQRRRQLVDDADNFLRRRLRADEGSEAGGADSDRTGKSHR